MLKIRIAVFAAMLCPLIICGQAAIKGRITDSNGEPLGNALVVLDNSFRYAYTDDEGGFYFSDLKEKEYQIEVTYLGYVNLITKAEARQNPVSLELELNAKPFLTDEVVVQATRLSQRAPATFKNVEMEAIQDLNLGQDLPMLINWTPSVVATSDAGAGIGYTSMRIRGSDQTRINVTVNGIPINDPESQGVFWVNMPDLSSSLSSVQIQRGLGSSTNGSGAFGASVNLETNLIGEEPGAMVSNSFGSFNTRKHTVEYNSGRMEGGFAIEGRLSQIKSDGYIDRASSDLKSYFLSAGYFGEKTVIKAITFAGAERTYQSWYGTPESRLNNDVEGMLTHAANEGYTEEQLQNLLNSGRTYNYYLYENEVDDYKQDHYQLHLIREISPEINLSLAGHYTYGRGFFEQYREGDSFSDYGLKDLIIGGDSISESDFIRRRWLDNDFYGGTYALNYRKDNLGVTLGGGIHFYRGRHFGEIVWAEYAAEIEHLQRYYQGEGNKDDYNSYLKVEYKLGKFDFMADMQVRIVQYEAFGKDNDLQEINVNENFNFLNPKVGARYTLNPAASVYAYFGRGNREPVRNDFIDAPEGEEPVHETLNNVELGYNYADSKLRVNINGYYMAYENQLVLTGELNDVGASVRRNVDRSYRMGVEFDATYALLKNFEVNANATLSRNKIRDFNEIVYSYTDEDVTTLINRFGDTDISFSPSVIAAARISWRPFKGFETGWISKYVGRQYLDNTQNINRSIDPYFVNDVRLSYTVENLGFKKVEFSLLINNVFNNKYVSNGYTYSYVYGDPVTENFFYPQAGTNFLAGLNLFF